MFSALTNLLTTVVKPVESMKANTNDEANKDMADIQRSTSELFLSPSQAGISISRQTTDKEDFLSSRDDLEEILKDFDPNKEETDQAIPSEKKSPASNDSIDQMAPRKVAATPKHESSQLQSENEDDNDDQREHGDGDAEHENEHEAHEEDDDEVNDDEEELFYSTPLHTQMILWHNHPLSHYVERARRILRLQPQIIIVGQSKTIARACSVVDILTHDKIGVIEKVSTDVHSDPYFDDVGDVRWTQSTPIIVFRLNQGEFAETLSEYQQIKMAEIFEKSDAEVTGFVSFEVAENMKLAEHFHATEEQVEAAKVFLSEREEEQLDLPGFLRYAQRLISPMLKDKVFKRVLTEKFDVGTAAGNTKSYHVSRQYVNTN